jgi:hypothetical protein
MLNSQVADRNGHCYLCRCACGKSSDEEPPELPGSVEGIAVALDGDGILDGRQIAAQRDVAGEGDGIATLGAGRRVERGAKV